MLAHLLPIFIFFVQASARTSSLAITPEYEKWLKASGITFSGASVGAAPKTSGGLKQKGLFASKDISNENFVFLKVPLHSAVINIEHALSDELFMKYFTSDALEALDDPTVMSAFVAFCRATQHSVWASYFASLPLEFTTPLYFPGLEELQASEVAMLAQERVKQLAKEYDALPKELQAIVSPSLFQWAYTILLSRSFGLQIKDAQGEWQGAACLVPGADLLNTGVRTNADCGTNEASTHFQCFTTTSVAKGEELLAPYGSFINEQKLLLDYGFILGVNFTARVILDPNWEPGSEHKPILGSVLHATERDFSLVKQVSQRALKDAEELLIGKFLIDRLQRHLASYSTSIEQDEETLTMPPYWNFDATCRGCFHSAIRLRLGEKKVYQNLLRDANAWLKDLETGLPKDEL